MTRRLLVLAALAALSIAACSGESSPAPGGTNTDDDTASASDAALLDLVNDPAVGLDALDKTIGLDSRAAKGIVARRAGADGVFPSADDAPFATVADLDAVPYVGASALAKLRAYATAHPSPHAETVEGVALLGWQVRAVTWGVDQASVHELDVDAALDSRAAKALVAAAPYADVAAMGPVSYVGPTALTALRAHALTWYAAESGAPSTCAEVLTSAANATVDAYSRDAIAFESIDAPMAWSLAAFSSPTCVDPSAPATASALEAALVAFAGWQHVIDDQPTALTSGPITAGSADLDAMVDQSMVLMNEIESDDAMNGDAAAAATLARLQTESAAVKALADDAHAGSTWTIKMHVDADECSEDGVILLDTASGLAVAIHESPGC
ncbi:MAG TPA: hypothetical protein VGM56_03140 [Byssovorax sp.]|jgi:hypothetical protein